MKIIVETSSTIFNIILKLYKIKIKGQCLELGKLTNKIIKIKIIEMFMRTKRAEAEII